jgi:cation diffusion facilitator CzcD-associated flavoprotein CzcO
MAELSAIIVGAGFSGLCAGIELRRAGITDFVILEKADRVGGTWRDNHYPGAACDIPSHLYSFSFAPNAKWSRSYGGQAEILAYLEHCADAFELRPHLRLGTTVEGAAYDEPSGTWTVHVRGGVPLVARTLILGNGALHVPALPDLPGRDRFAGAAFHSSRWDDRVALDGKRVAVIGTGASAVQFIPQIAPRVAQLSVFQRTPPWILPKSDAAIGRSRRWIYQHVPGAHWLHRTLLYWLLESRVLGFAFAPWINRIAEWVVRRHLARSVADPALRERLTPSYRLGCKRVLISSDYYAALCRDNVELVTDPIAAIEPAGIRGNDGSLREFDAIIYGTGFHLSDVSAIRIVGAGQRELSEVWRSAVRSYLGITVSGFPNLFLMFGPHTVLGHNSMIFMIEAQARYAVQAIRALGRNALASLDVLPAVEQAFGAEMTRRLKRTVWTTGCRSWYMAPDGDVLLWPGFTFDYWRRTRRIDLRDYEVRAIARSMSRSDLTSSSSAAV